MNIVVTSNCTTGGICAGLRAMLPDSTITPVDVFQTTQEDGRALDAALSVADAWVTLLDPALYQQKPALTIRIPAFSFTAFHPDLVYARNAHTGLHTEFHYNSAIAIWAYNNQIAAADATQLFNGRVFKALGYLDQWDNSVDLLRRLFVASSLTQEDFYRFFLTVKRRGLFMHSVNHPHVGTVIALTQVIARHLDADPRLVDRSLELPDGLTEHIWPLYPDIGMALGLPGSWVWRIGYRELGSLTDYLQYAYADYERQSIKPGDLVIENPPAHLDRVLRSETQQS